jgi:hypothetical protein
MDEMTETKTMKLPSVNIIKMNGWAIEAEQAAKVLEVNNDQDDQTANEIFLKVKKFVKDSDAERSEFKEPFLKMGKTIDGTYKPFLDRFKSAADVIEQKILQWRAKKRQILAEAEAKAKAEFEAKLKAEEKKIAKNPLLEQEYIPPPVQYIPETSVRTESGSSTERKVWTYEVTDFSKLHDQFKTENSKVINDAIRAGERNIPGLRIYQEVSLSGRTKQ